MKNLTLILIVFQVTLLYGQEDTSCKDHPLLNRYPNSFIIQCSPGNEQFYVQVAEDRTEMKEGKSYYAQYATKVAPGSKPPTFNEIESFFESTVIKKGGATIYENDSTTSATYNFQNG